ncbi:hypothetical protein [Demetria terragena]|uniref:hypothetical protein n=1 Tax=Demetria terragena TaxID=63959 RepID=UPI000376162D|nr:hypothetical protein [Demetria terragena]
MARELVVSDPAMASLLTHRDAPHYLGPFLERERSIREVAGQMRKPIGRVHYWVRRLYDAGLLEITTEVPRAGRPIKHYRAIASHFRVPAHLVPVNHFERTMSQISAEVTSALAAAGEIQQHDLTVSPSINGNATVDRISDLQVAKKILAVQWGLGDVHLTRAQAEAFQEELFELRDRLLDASDPATVGTRPFIVNLAMVPRQE